MICRICGKPMVLRIQRSTGDLFWGCAGYPRCTHTERYVEEESVVRKAFSPTEEQQAIFSHIQHSNSNLIINAVAGSGKTTTILQSMTLLPLKAKAVFLAFNKSIADTLSTRAPQQVEVKTLHSLGFRLIKKRYPHAKMVEHKVDDLLKDMLTEADYKRNNGIIAQVFSLMLNNDLFISEETVEEVLEYYAIDTDIPTPQLFRWLRDLWFLNQEAYEKGRVSFDDMIVWPAYDKSLCETYDYIFVDECQDLNKIQMKFIVNSVVPGTKVVCVGDRNQAIYGFRGASADAMDFLKDTLDAEELPLTICFRCPTAHIAMAQKIVPQIVARPDAPFGTIDNHNLASFMKAVDKYDLVLCRFNAPLLPLAIKLVKEDKRAFVRGRDIAASLTTMLNKERGKDIEDAIESIVKKSNDKVERLTKHGKLGQAANVLDLCDCAVFVLQECTSVDAAMYQVTILFQEAEDSVVFSSIHKAKGLEAEKVFLIDYHKLPMRTKTDWEATQELNLMYVALTRAKQLLGFIKLT